MIQQKRVNLVARQAVNALNRRKRGNLEDYLFKKGKELLASLETYVNDDGLGWPAAAARSRVLHPDDRRCNKDSFLYTFQVMDDASSGEYCTVLEIATNKQLTKAFRLPIRPPKRKLKKWLRRTVTTR